MTATDARAARRSVTVTFVTLGLGYGVWYSYSVFLVALLREYGWSRSLVAGVFSMFTLVHGLASFPLGWLADRLGPRRVIVVGAAVLGAGLLLDGAIDRPWQLYVAYGIVTSLGVAASGWVPAVVLVQRWYPLRVGTMLGLTSAGIGVGIFVMVPVAQALIDAVGWRWAFRLVGIAIVLWMLPVSVLILRDPPAPAPPRGSAAGTRDVTLRDAIMTAPFWLYALAQGSGSFANQMLLVHQVAYLVDHGVSTFVAASVVGAVGLASIVSKGAGGWVSDTIGRETTYAIGSLCVIASVGALGIVAWAPGPVPAYAYGILVGIGYSVTAPLMPALVSDAFRGRNFGMIFGSIQVSNAIGGSLGPWVGGHVFDTTGSYAPAFGAAIAMSLCAVTALWVARSRR